MKTGRINLRAIWKHLSGDVSALDQVVISCPFPECSHVFILAHDLLHSVHYPCVLLIGIVDEGERQNLDILDKGRDFFVCRRLQQGIFNAVRPKKAWREFV